MGEIAEPTAEDLDAELAAVSGEVLTLSLEGAGAFGEGEASTPSGPGWREPRRSASSAHRCERAARRAGLAPGPRIWKPHVTLAYLQTVPTRRRVAAWIQSHNLLEIPAVPVTSFGLYSSWLGQGGARYHLEADYPLG